VTIHDNVLRGRLKALSVADILLFLKGLNRVGRLALIGDRSEATLDLRGPWIIRAESDRAADRIEEVLLESGRITREECEDVRRRAAEDPDGGIGRALVASGLLTARALVAARREQARRIVLSLFDWTTGGYAFEEGRGASGWSTPLDLPIVELVADGIRGVRDAELFVDRMPSPEWVFEPAPQAGGPALTLDSHEAQILDLADGTRSIAAIEALAEYPPAEIRRVLFLLLSVGLIRPQSRPSAADARPEAEPFVEIVRRFNGMFGRVYQYMTLELGPISENLLSASLRDLEGAHAPIFRRARLAGDGTLSGETLESNLRSLEREGRRGALVSGLNELLYRELLVLRQALGQEHERRVLHLMQRDGLLGATAGAP
jgi:Domain of unknown function (DUF4388)